MTVPLWLPIVVMAIGVLLILNAIVTVLTNKPGRLPLNPLVTIVLAFGLILLGQYLLRD